MRSGMTTGAELRRADRGEPFEAMYHVNLVGPGYFSTMGISLVRGREFLATDRRGSPIVAVINEEFARRHFPADDPIGRTLLLPGDGASYPAEIVGVVRDSKYRTIGEDQIGAVYEAFLQRGNRGRFVHVLVRAERAAETIGNEVERTLSALDPTAAVSVVPMRSALAFAFLPSRFGAALLGTLGLLGLCLAMVGLYATIAYAVARRTGEIGVRIALGASRRAVLRLVLGDAAMLAGSGILLGLGVAIFVTQPLGMFLVSGLNAADPLNFLGPALLLLAISLAAAASPARRALRIDPVAALRRE
jgi:ABC-type antimicrobial peptide transport system permease subunit